MITLHYGTKGLGLSIPAKIKPVIIQKPPMPLIKNVSAAIEEMFDKPIGSESLKQLCVGKKSACIVICDITRPVPNHLFLQPLIKRLMQFGIAKEKICILIATGLHRPNLGEELKSLINDEWVMANIEIMNHDARDDAMHIDLGFTATRQTPIKVDKRFVNADLKIVTGLVEPHFMAGFSGGRKVIAPGIAHADTITTFHNHKFMSNKDATGCNLINNPLHEEQLEIVKKVSPVYAINTVIDEHRQLAHVNFGDILKSHHEAVEFVRKFVELPFTKKFKNILTTSAGEPLDKTYYQTIKGLVAVLDIIEDGGHVLIASSCRERIGSPEFIESQTRLMTQGTQKFLADISSRDRATVDEWQTQMLTKVLAKCHIHLLSEHLTEQDYKLTGATRVNALEDAMIKISGVTGSNEWAIIPEGPYVTPVYRP